MSDFQFRAKIEKVDDELMIAFGWLYMSELADGTQVIDNSGEYIEADDLELAAYDYVIESRSAAVMHQPVVNDAGETVGECCESVVTTRQKQAMWGLPEGSMPVGWWVGIQIFDEALWQDVKSGKVQMFSIGGTATKEPGATTEDDAPGEYAAG